MAARTLCGESLRVALDGGGDRTLVLLTNGTEVGFWVDTAILEEAVEGGLVQLSAHEGYCTFEIEGDEVRVTYGVPGSGRHACQLATPDFAEALADVRRRPATE